MANLAVIWMMSSKHNGMTMSRVYVCYEDWFNSLLLMYTHPSCTLFEEPGVDTQTYLACFAFIMLFFYKST